MDHVNSAAIIRYHERQLFALGREVMAELRGDLRPSRKSMKVAAAKLHISQSLAWRAFNKYAFES